MSLTSFASIVIITLFNTSVFCVLKPYLLICNEQVYFKQGTCTIKQNVSTFLEGQCKNFPELFGISFCWHRSPK